MKITIKLTDKQVQEIKPILDPHNEHEEMPDKADIKNWIENMIDSAIEFCPGYY